MARLYSQLARAYHEMYQTIFDYRKDFKIYDRILKNHGCKKILEIGCGSGNLAKYFLESGYSYLGLDYSKDMLSIAKKVASDARFIRGDMRHLNLEDRFDAVLITGRSFTYMTANKDVTDCLKSVYSVLRKGGVFIFGNFDAEKIFGDFKKQTVHTAEYGKRKYKRVSRNSFNLETGWTWNWNTAWYVTEKGKTKVIKDKSILRAFTEDELGLFLKMNNFEVLKFMKDRNQIRTVARKI